jgi:hypothetical protein
MQIVNENGVATKELAKGNYTVELQFTDTAAGYVCDTEDMTLTADKTELTVILSRGLSEETRDLVVGENTYAAHYVNTGCTKVPLNETGRTYFLFAPVEDGLYEFSVVGSDATIGYYGAPHFVQEQNVGDMVDNVITISITGSMIGTGNTGTTVLVLGIDPGTAENAVLAINRIGAHQWTVEDEPWLVYQTTAKLAPYTLPEGAVIREFDLTGSYELVLNEADGFYHLDSVDGPLVLARLAEPNQYLDSFKTILDNTAIRRYFFENDGTFIRKEEYSNCVLEYLQYVDEDAGVYPLTEDLMYIIRQHGEYAGWYDKDGGQYLFRDSKGSPLPGINEEISWLFTCCYIETK